ncbi:ABC transporter ATP-binding protein [Rhizobium sp. SSA_523]|uniref:ABC transporter ATP-binding protein n=1 Tax=Rhizobium sp. SSA_523 TaxID=2952477 RepID=UPI00209059AD|nr:ABC transporter ATP-binding protein [Rhizobium sp. SSA_523]MCO5731597.1 ABC transporter ATP-binding protein [Rhizobium sp. SSA_523]WKC21889.1 ABC transporter ATP-binding protein [Rhizobium sp. SSA_523]
MNNEPSYRDSGSDLSAPVIEARSVDHFYEGQGGWNHALSNLNFSIPRNEFLCIIGPSGCGKSTFLKIVTGLVKPTSGEVLLNGKAIKGPGPDRGIVFQEPALFAWRTVIENVEFGLQMQKVPKAEARARAQTVLDIVGLGHVGNLYPYQLSGGMRHRVAVARAWALPSADLLLMDEPFSAIDAINRMTLQDYLVDTWLKDRRTVIYITHDIDEAVYLADRILLMRPSPGRIGRFFQVDMPRPRDRNGADFAELKGIITEEMHRSAGDDYENSEEAEHAA